MKYLAFIAVLAISSFSFATERITILEDQINRYGYQLETNARYFMDTDTGVGYADVTIDQITYQWVPGPGRCGPHYCSPTGHNRVPVRNLIYSKRVEIPNLELRNKEMIFDGINGEINCGKLGTSRWLRRPTLYLTGNCFLRTRLDRGGNLKVTFSTK